MADALFWPCMVGAFGMSIAFWVARGAEAVERPVLIRRARASTLAMADLMLGSLFTTVVLTERITTPGGWVAVGACASLLLALAGAAVAVARGRLWPPPEFTEPAEVPVRPPGTPRPIGGAHAAPLAPLWSTRRFVRRPWRVGGGGAVLLAAGIALGAMAASRGNVVGVVLCGLGILCAIGAVGVRDAWGALLGAAGVTAASVATLAGWFGPAAFIVAALGISLLGVIYHERDEAPAY